MKRPGEVVLSAVCGLVAAAAALALAAAGFFLIYQGGEGYASFDAAWRGAPLLHTVRALLSAVVFGVTSATMLEGRRWARDVFIGWSWLQLILNFATGPHFLGGWSPSSFLQLVGTLVLTYLLLTGASPDYFAAEPV